MKNTMAVKESWPYIQRHHPIESDLHVRLKNLSVYWLLQRDFTVGDIEQERIIKRDAGRGSSAQTDIYANNGEREIFIECETDFGHSPHSLSFGGKIPARNGKEVYVFDSEEVHRIECDENKVWSFDVVQPLPAVDLRAFQF